MYTLASAVATKLPTDEDSRARILASAIAMKEAMYEDSNELHKTPLIEITVAIRIVAVLPYLYATSRLQLVNTVEL